MTNSAPFPAPHPGFPRYLPVDFEMRFEVPSETAHLIAQDYYDIINTQSVAKPSQGMLKNAKEWLPFCISRYGLTKKLIAPIAQYLFDIGRIRAGLDRTSGLGITQAKWVFNGACGGRMGGLRGAHCTGHEEANGKVYPIGEGLNILGETVFPGTEFDCYCIAMSVIPGLDDPN